MALDLEQIRWSCSDLFPGFCILFRKISAFVFFLLRSEHYY